MEGVGDERSRPRRRFALPAFGTLVFSVIITGCKKSEQPAIVDAAADEQVAVRCSQMAARLERGQVADADLEFVGSSGEARGTETWRDVFRRFATRSLTPADLAWKRDQVTTGTILCGSELWNALVTVIVSTPAAWQGDFTVISDDMRSAVTAKGLSGAVKDTIVAGAETSAKAGARKTGLDELANAKRACDLVTELKAGRGIAVRDQ